MAPAPGPRPRNRDINAAVGRLQFARQLVGLDFEFRPSIGLLARNVDRLAKDIQSFREPLMRSIVEVMIPSFKANFAAEGRPPWEPLAPYTVERRKYQEHPILKRSGRLYKAATSQALWDVSKVGAVITKFPGYAWYAGIHQGGLAGFGQHLGAAKKELGEDARPRELTMRAYEKMDEAGGGNRAAPIPARPFIMFHPEDEDAIQEIFFEWLEQRIDKYWTRMGG